MHEGIIESHVTSNISDSKVEKTDDDGYVSHTNFFTDHNDKIFALSINLPDDPALWISGINFDTEYFKNRINNFVNNFDENPRITFVKLESVILLQFIELHIRAKRNIQRKKFKILKIGFLGTLDKDLRCVVILSKKKEIETDLTIEEVDEMVDYTDCSYNSIVPVRLDRYFKSEKVKK